ncbi:MAG: mannitol dehydrogenase family protein [Ornithinimicrobium sp.]
MTSRLTTSALERISGDVSVPHYDRAAITAGIVHLGVGGFHRAHQAAYLDRLLEEGVEGAMEWGIVGVGVLAHDQRIVDILNEQDGLYTMVVKHPDGSREYRVVGSIVEMLLAPQDPQKIIDVMAADSTRIVSLTITEGGYLLNQATGEFDPADDGIQHDLKPDVLPRTAFGLIVAALAQRRDAGQDPFTVMSCDNLPGNGDIARTTMTAFARMKDPGLADWMDQFVHFPNGMVDRITPATTSDDIEALAEATGIDDKWPVVCEPFTQWVLEDSFGQGRPALDQAGVQLVEDVVPFELMKLRLLNAGHQVLAYLGYLSDFRYAHHAADDELFAEFLHGYMEHEAQPTLPSIPDTDLVVYRHTLLERFANPEVKDTLARLATDGSDRLPKFLLPVIKHNLAHGGRIDHSALVVAAWARYAEGTDEGGEPIDVQDRLKEQLMSAAAAHPHDELAFIRDRDLFDDLADNERFASAYRTCLNQLHEGGARSAMEQIVRTDTK